MITPGETRSISASTPRSARFRSPCEVLQALAADAPDDVGEVLLAFPPALPDRQGAHRSRHAGLPLR